MENSATTKPNEPWGYSSPDVAVSIEDFEKLIGEAYTLKKEAKALEDKAEDIKLVLKEKQVKIEAIMDQLGKEVYKSDSGTVTLKTSLSVTTPKDPNSKTEFFAWLHTQNLFDEYATVDSRKLNTLFNSLAEGNPEFTLPGIEKPKPFKTLKLLK